MRASLPGWDDTARRVAEAIHQASEETMSGFSTDWLDLREDADRRARDAGLEARLAEHLPGVTACASSILAAAPARMLAPGPDLPDGQAWRFVDHDVDLLAAARAGKDGGVGDAQDDLRRQTTRYHLSHGRSERRPANRDPARR